MKALVVESSNTMRLILRRILSKRGFEVVEAENGRKAQEVLNSLGTVDLVFVNWILGEAEGLDLVTRLRHESIYDSKIIMMATAEPGVHDLQRALIAGANEYLMKPFSSKQIDERLDSVGLI